MPNSKPKLTRHGRPRSAHSSDFALLAAVIPKLEAAARTVKPSKRADYEKLLARSYQAASAGFAYHNETDAAWVAADRALAAAEASGDPYQILASHFRLAHSFIRLNRFDQADLLATNGIEALKPVDGRQPDLPALSLQGALLLVRAVVAGLQSDRTRAPKPSTPPKRSPANSHPTKTTTTPNSTSPTSNSTE